MFDNQRRDRERCCHCRRKHPFQVKLLLGHVGKDRFVDKTMSSKTSPQTFPKGSQVQTMEKLIVELAQRRTWAIVGMVLSRLNVKEQQLMLPNMGTKSSKPCVDMVIMVFIIDKSTLLVYGINPKGGSIDNVPLFKNLVELRDRVKVTTSSL